MAIDNDGHKSLEKLRQLAIEKLSMSPPAALSVRETEDLLYELRLHQIELEMQNEELRLSQRELELSREKYFKLYDIAPIGICSISGSGFIAEANLKICELLGLDRTQLKGQPFSSFIFKDDQDMYYLAIKHISKAVDSQTCELRFIRRNGDIFWVLLDISLAQDADGIIFYLVAVYDITGRKQTEIELRREHESLANILEGTNTGTWEWNVQTGQTVFNERWAQIIGYTLEEISPVNIDTWQKFAHPEDGKKSEAQLSEVFNRERDYYSVECRMKHKNGSWVWVQDRGKVISWTPEGKPLWMSGTHTDITRRKLAEEDVKKSEIRAISSEARLKKAQAIAHVGDWSWDLKENYVEWSNEMYRIFGIDKESYTGSLGEEIIKAIHPDDLYIVLPSNASAFTKEEPVEYRIVLPDKSVHNILAETGEVILNSDGEPYYLTGTCQDITDRKKAEQALRESEGRYRMLSEQSPITIERYNKDGVLLDVNPACLILFGIEDAREIRNFNLFADPNISNENKEILRRGETVHYQGLFDFDKVKEFKLYNTTKSGSIWIDVIITPFDNKNNNGDSAFEGYLVYITDITESKMAEAEIRHISYHDKLTDLYNRRFFEEEIKRLDTERQLPLSIIIGDLNNLKITNDAFGHQEGDMLLKETAKLLKKACRSDDILARWGGDEFVILLPKTSIAAAEVIAQRIKKECSELFIQNIPIGLATGIAAKTAHIQNIEDIIIEAESNMYKNKLAGKQSSAGSVIAALEQALYEKSNETMEHTQRIKELSLKFGKKLKLHLHQLDELSLLASLHDIGKVAVPETILLKEGALSESEWEVMRTHPATGFNIAQSSPQIAHIAKYILSCHENWDGSGYPEGLAREEIPLLSRVVAITDSYDVMTSARTYKTAMSEKDAVRELKRCAGTQFDPVLVEKLIEVLVEQGK